MLRGVSVQIPCSVSLTSGYGWLRRDAAGVGMTVVPGLVSVGGGLVSLRVSRLTAVLGRRLPFAVPTAIWERGRWAAAVSSVVRSLGWAWAWAGFGPGPWFNSLSWALAQLSDTPFN